MSSHLLILLCCTAASTNNASKMLPIWANAESTCHKSQRQLAIIQGTNRRCLAERGRQRLIECICGGVAAHASSSCCCCLSKASPGCFSSSLPPPASALQLGRRIYLHCGLDFTFKGYDVVVSAFHYLLLPARKGLAAQNKSQLMRPLLDQPVHAAPSP